MVPSVSASHVVSSVAPGVGVSLVLRRPRAPAAYQSPHNRIGPTAICSGRRQRERRGGASRVSGGMADDALCEAARGSGGVFSPAAFTCAGDDCVICPLRSCYALVTE